MLDRLCGRSIYSTLLLLAGADPQHFAQHTGATRGARSPPSEGRTRALVSQDDSWRPMTDQVHWEEEGFWQGCVGHATARMLNLLVP